LEQVVWAKLRIGNGNMMGGQLGEERLPSLCPNWSVAWELRFRDLESMRKESQVEFLEVVLPDSPNILHLRGIQIGRVVKARSKIRAGLPAALPTSTTSLFKIEALHLQLPIRKRFDQMREEIVRSRVLFECKAQEDNLIIVARGFYFPVLLRLHENRRIFLFAGSLSTGSIRGKEFGGLDPFGTWCDTFRVG
jgi:hypothetical protein